MRISDWSSDVCSSDLIAIALTQHLPGRGTIRLGRCFGSPDEGNPATVSGHPQLPGPALGIACDIAALDFPLRAPPNHRCLALRTALIRRQLIRTPFALSCQPPFPDLAIDRSTVRE